MRERARELYHRYLRLLRHVPALQEELGFTVTAQRLMVMVIAYEIRPMDSDTCREVVVELVHHKHYPRLRRLRYKNPALRQLSELTRLGAMYTRKSGRRPVFYLRASARRALERALEPALGVADGAG